MDSKRKSLLKDFWFVPLTILILIGIFASGLRVCFTVGESMYPTLSNGEPLLLNTKNKTPDRYDIIVFQNEQEGVLIKRVIGLPGEHVQIKENVIYINGTPIEDPVDVTIEEYGYLKEGITLNDNQYFAMGDNRNHSLDSRILGPVDNFNIIGTIKCRLPGFDKI